MSRFFYLKAGFLLVLLSGCQYQNPYQNQALEVFPSVAIRHASLFRMDQLPISPAFFKDRWTIVVFGSSSCLQSCQFRLQQVNEVKTAQSLFAIVDLADHARLRELAKDYPAIAIGMGTTAVSFDNFYAQFYVESIKEDEKMDFIYLVNPASELTYTLSVKELKKGDIDKEMGYLNKIFPEE